MPKPVILRRVLDRPGWRSLSLAVLFGGIVGLGGFTFFYAEGFSYLSNNPAACANCHVMREVYDAWHHGSHKAVATCNTCHVPHVFPLDYMVKGLNGWNHSVAFTLENFPEPIRITALNRSVALSNCFDCHGDIVTAMGAEHTDEPTDCLRCHAGVGHRP